MVVIVLGTHGGGTSLVAGLLDALGVDMRYNPRAKITVPRGTYTNFEDSNLVRINNAILKKSGGNWSNPPPLANVRFRDRQEARVKEWVGARQARAKGGAWGAKDPRHCLTIQLFHPFLEPLGVRYVAVTRNPTGAARSIMSRGPSRRARAAWVKMSKAYLGRASAFLGGVDSPVFEVDFAHLVGGKRIARDRVAELARFVGAPQKRVPAAMRRIKRR